MENSMIKIARYRNTPYIFNFITNGGSKRYEWAGSKGDKYDVKTLPIEAVDWLLMNSVCFKNGELVIVEDSDDSKELTSNLGGDLEDYVSNTHSRTEIIDLLEGTYLKMKSEFEKINSASEKKFVVDIAKELSADLTGGKLKFISEWINIPQDILFD
jgi:hypothetical protein